MYAADRREHTFFLIPSRCSCGISLGLPAFFIPVRFVSRALAIGAASAFLRQRAMLDLDMFANLGCIFFTALILAFLGLP